MIHHIRPSLRRGGRMSVSTPCIPGTVAMIITHSDHDHGHMAMIMATLGHDPCMITYVSRETPPGTVAPQTPTHPRKIKIHRKRTPEPGAQGRAAGNGNLGGVNF